MSKFSALSGTGKPYRVFVKLAGEPLVDKDGNQAYVDIHSEDSSIGRQFDQELRDRLLKLSSEGKPFPTQLEQNRAKAAALTAEWYLVNPDTLEQITEPCSRENALELYSLPDTDWIWGPAWSAANNRANFIKRSAKSSSSSQGGTSETTVS